MFCKHFLIAFSGFPLKLKICDISSLKCIKTTGPMWYVLLTVFTVSNNVQTQTNPQFYSSWWDISLCCICHNLCTLSMKKINNNASQLAVFPSTVCNGHSYLITIIHYRLLRIVKNNFNTLYCAWTWFGPESGRFSWPMEVNSTTPMITCCFKT